MQLFHKNKSSNSIHVMKRQTALDRASIQQPSSNNNVGVVGTEAIAQTNIKRNSKEFHYPEEGFVTPIEHSLLYNMIKEPKIYPRDVLIQHILEEDYSIYLPIKEKTKKDSSIRTTSTTTETSIAETSTTSSSTTVSTTRESYAQLSALLAICGENYPPIVSSSENSNTNNNTNNNTSSSNDANHTNNNNNNNNVSEVLGKTILKFIIHYCEEHNLDRECEIQELLKPVENYVIRRSANVELQGVLPLYAGYTASLVTANPIPLLIGFAVWNNKMMESQETLTNLKSFKDETTRRSNVETTSLLDEMD